ncbi:MAG: murein hydrolase activator EnvC [Nitrospirales bacterium]|nr:peptidoglycan DD-metalloendopeptidase family protein [Nitrospirales bacterium]
MMRPGTPYFPAGWLAFLGIMCFSLQAWAGKSDSMKEEISQERQRLEQLNREIQKTQEQAQQVEKQHGSVLKNIEKLDRQLYQHKKDRKRIDKQILEKDEELQNLTGQIQAIDQNIQSHQSSIAARLRLLYTEGHSGYLQSLFAAESFADMANRMDFVSWVARREGQLVQQFQENLDQLHALTDQQTQAREALLALHEETDKSIKDISGLKRSKRTVLTSLSREKSLHERTLEDLQRSAEEVDKLVKELDQRFQMAQARLRQAPGKIPSLGSFLWPAQGKVVSYFGRQKHPTFDTFVNKKGIEIQVREGTPIQSISDGTVVYADWLKGYGLVVIVDHGTGFYSLYAHASKLMVKENDRVKAGHQLGETGETGLAQEDTLYFELRKGTTPIDPMKWLAKQR